MNGTNGQIIESPVTRRQHTELEITDDKLDLLKRTICKGATDDEFEMFCGVCKRTGLDPFARQIFAVKRPNKKAGRDDMTIQVSIDGFRLIADRSGKYAGQVGPQWCGEDGKWLDVWTNRTVAPTAARVGVLRSDFKEPVWGVARFESYAQYGFDGLNHMWSKMGDAMIAKCAEAQALRKAFPQDLSGLYTTDEMLQAMPQGAEAPDADERPASNPKVETARKALEATKETPKVALAKEISDWSGMPQKDAGFAATCGKVFDAALGSGRAKKLTDEQVGIVLNWCHSQREKGVEFAAVYNGEVAA